MKYSIDDIVEFLTWIEQEPRIGRITRILGATVNNSAHNFEIIEENGLYHTVPDYSVVGFVEDSEPPKTIIQRLRSELAKNEEDWMNLRRGWVGRKFNEDEI